MLDEFQCVLIMFFAHALAMSADDMFKMLERSLIEFGRKVVSQKIVRLGIAKCSNSISVFSVALR